MTRHDNLPVLRGVRVTRLGSALAGDFLLAILRDAGADVLEAKAVADADVVVDDLGRGVRRDPDVERALHAAAAHVVSCSLVSFPEGGPTGLPELEDDPVLAVLGVNRLNGDAPEHEPLRMPSLYAAQVAALHIGCALLQRARGDQRPQHIEVSLFGAALNVLGRQLVRFDDARLFDPLSRGWRFPTANARRCADGRWIQPHGMFPHFLRTLMQVGGHPEWAEEAAAGLHHLPDAATVDLWNTRLDTIFARRTALQWEEAINSAGGACTLCRTREEWAATPHAQACGLHEPAPGVVVQATEPLPPVQSDRSALPVPAAAEAARPLSGVRIVDFCIIIAGPAAGRILAELGADVVKVEDPGRYVNPSLWLDVNRGKRSVVLDLRQEAARRVAWRLVEGADVVLENFRAGKLERLGLGCDTVRMRRPGVIYASSNAMDLLGPWASRAGWEHNAQAGTGMQWARAPQDAPTQVPFPVNDYATGLFTALGVVWALLHRQRTGAGARVRTSLARSACYLQRFDPSGGRRGPGLSLRSLHCADGWVTVYRGDFEGGAWQSLQDEAPALGAEAVLERAHRLGWPATRERRPVDLHAEPWLWSAGLMTRWTHPRLGLLSQGTPGALAFPGRRAPRGPAPEPGDDGSIVLSELGLAGEEAALRASGAVGGFRLFPEEVP